MKTRLLLVSLFVCLFVCLFVPEFVKSSLIGKNERAIES